MANVGLLSYWGWSPCQGVLLFHNRAGASVLARTTPDLRVVHCNLFCKLVVCDFFLSIAVVPCARSDENIVYIVVNASEKYAALLTRVEC